MQVIASMFTYVFTSPWFLYLAVPVIVAGLAIVLKASARSERTPRVTREDFLVGFDLGVMAVVTMLAVAAKAAKNLQDLTRSARSTRTDLDEIQRSLEHVVSAPILVLLFAACLWALSRFTAKKGWQGDPSVLATKYIIGVDAIGFLLLSATLLMTGEVK